MFLYYSIQRNIVIYISIGSWRERVQGFRREVQMVAKRWRERIGDGKRCTQPRWKHACELLEEIEGVVF